MSRVIRIFFIKISDIDWRKRVFLTGGGFANIYRVAPGFVAKVGSVSDEEYHLQRAAAAAGLAIPPADYTAEAALPGAVSREVCPVHGKRRRIVPCGCDCACQGVVAVLLMPEAKEPAQERITEEVDRLFDSLETAGVWWPDPRPANVLSYQGRVVACDFGRADA
jgi:hypothetical protein